VAAAERGLESVRNCSEGDVRDLLGETPGGDPLFESVLDIAEGEPVGPSGAVVLSTAVRTSGGATVLTSLHRADLFAPEHAARICGYHLSALEVLAHAPDAAAGEGSLLSEAELRVQLHGLAGERLELPERGFHELFEERARTAPDAVALKFDGGTWTYAELDRRANGVAHALLKAGLVEEDIVAVVSPRTPEWVAAAVGVLKAGGAYLPVDPEFPADRIARILGISAARFVLRSGAGDGDAPPETGAPAPAVLSLEAAVARERTNSPGLSVRPDQLAYLYFTSGSTGTPKGVMCEHAGMVNHLLAKIGDMELDHTSVVVQNAPQCFDISLWQFAAPLMVGGRSLLVGQESILEVERFVTEITGAGATVLQVVPSYLDVLLGYLESSERGLEGIRYVSVTGEAVSRELLERWFARFDIPVVNAYGATEASDDTTHEIMRAAPAPGSVPVGRPVGNVRVYVLDENLALVPLGAPGQVAFSGVSVGRGYVNDPERTRLAFVEDPYMPHHRLYLTGDYGRWNRDGHLEFIGRRDQQIKIRGFRVEIGEIEDRLRRMPGVRDAAVVVEDSDERSKNLVAFYAAPATLSLPDLQDFLEAALPKYMVPSHFHRIDPLPVTENGKTDRGALAALAGTLGHESGTRVAPANPAELALAAAWAEVLGVALERIGRDSHFFQVGGSSLAAVRLVMRLDRRLSLTDVVNAPRLEDMALCLEDGADEVESVLHLLSTGAAGALATVVCFPPSAGNAVNFRPLARELEESGYALYGVEPPGHDLRRGDQTLASVGETAARVAREVLARAAEPLVLYGQGSGTATALATAALLQEQGADPHHVFLSGWSPGDADDLRARIRASCGTSDARVREHLSADLGYIELGEGREERTHLLGAAYRHDESDAARYLLEALDDAARARVRVPVTVLVADDDPAAEELWASASGWKRFADSVHVRTLSGGRQHFRTSPEGTAAALTAVAGAVQGDR